MIFFPTLTFSCIRHQCITLYLFPGKDPWIRSTLCFPNLSSTRLTFPRWMESLSCQRDILVCRRITQTKIWGSCDNRRSCMSLFKDGLRCPMWMTAFYFRPAIQDLPLDGFDPSPVESDEKKKNRLASSEWALGDERVRFRSVVSNKSQKRQREMFSALFPCTMGGWCPTALEKSSLILHEKWGEGIKHPPPANNYVVLWQPWVVIRGQSGPDSLSFPSNTTL